ncbi:MAG: response regulator transcription factor [Proteobacteria bacterium]|nr:response regulator transcription factor [Pseudomonadota bacterium]
MTKSRPASLTPEDAEKWIDGHADCSMIIYNVGGGTLADHKHLKRIRELRARGAGAPLVILSDNNSREEILSALSIGAQGFLYTGTNARLALQALSFILQGGSFFPAAIQSGRRHPIHLNGAADSISLPAAKHVLEEGNANVQHAAGADSKTINLTTRQKSVLERLSRGEANKAIARKLGIREATVKVHVRQIMRKLGVANRTQVAILSATGSKAEMLVDNRSVDGKVNLASTGIPFASGERSTT